MLSVIVVNYNTRDLTAQCLNSIEGQAAQIIVVDNSSSDGSREMLVAWEQASTAHQLILSSSNDGFSRANNLGMRVVDQQYVLLLNSDTSVSRGVLVKLVKWMDNHPDVGACGPKLVYPDGIPQPSPSPLPTAWMYVVRFLGLKYLLPGNKIKKMVANILAPMLGETLRSHMNPGDDFQGNIGFLSGAALLVRKEVIDKVGGLDEGYFMYLEDADWCIRIKNAGWKLGFVPEVEVLHYAGASFKGDLVRKSFRAANPESFKSIMRYMYTYYGAGGRAVVRIVVTVSLLAQSLVAVFRIFGGNRQSIIPLISGNIGNISIVWRARP